MSRTHISLMKKGMSLTGKTQDACKLRRVQCGAEKKDMPYD